jgi:hypothetical protein
MKNVVFWDVGPSISCVNRRFGGTYHLHLQGRNIRERGTSVSRWLQTWRHTAEDGILQINSYLQVNAYIVECNKVSDSGALEYLASNSLKG